MKKVLLIACILVSVVLSGCGDGGKYVFTADPDLSAENLDKTDAVNSMENVGNENEENSESSEDLCTVKEGMNAEEELDMIEPVNVTDNFGAASYIVDKLYENKNSNVMYSPLSVEMALGVLSQGAKGETLDQLNGFLGREDYNEYAKDRLEKDDVYEDKNNQVNIANALWIDKSLKVDKEFIKSAKLYFGAEVENLDFSNSSKAAKKINKWCDDNTKGMIKKLVDEGGLSNSEAIITNTVYFKGQWYEALVRESMASDFNNADGSVKPITYLTGTTDVYYENEYAQAFDYPYKNGYRFIGILPKATGDFELSELDINNLIQNPVDDVEVNFKMPELDFETDNDILKESLYALGVKKIFETDGDLSGISDNSLKIEKIMQKCNIKLDENGTEAAAATALDMMITSFMPDEKETQNVVLDRPYAFMIVSGKKDAILFLGKVGFVD